MSNSDTDVDDLDITGSSKTEVQFNPNTHSQRSQNGEREDVLAGEDYVPNDQVH